MADDSPTPAGPPATLGGQFARPLEPVERVRLESLVGSMPVRDLVRALGGPKKVGQALGVTLEAVCNWQARNAVPAARELAVWRLAEAKGLAWRPAGAAGLVLPGAGPSQDRAA